MRVKKSKFCLGLLVSMFFASVALASESSHGINWWHLGSDYEGRPALGWLSLTFLIFIIIMFRVIKRPLSLYLETRSKDIRKQIEEGKKAQLASEQKLKLYEEKLRSLDFEIANIKQAFQEQANSEKAEKERQSKILEAKIMRDTDDTIKSDFEQSKNRLAQAVIEKAVATAQKIIIESKKDEVDRALKENLIADVTINARELCQ